MSSGGYGAGLTLARTEVVSSGKWCTLSTSAGTPVDPDSWEHPVNDILLKHLGTKPSDSGSWTAMGVWSGEGLPNSDDIF